jgi:hypothetical protein
LRRASDVSQGGARLSHCSDLGVAQLEGVVELGCAPLQCVASCLRHPARLILDSPEKAPIAAHSAVTNLLAEYT